MWSYRTLDRNIGSQYYERLLLSQHKDTVKSKYMLYMPTEEELREEIERQKEFYRLQHDKLTM